MSNTHIAQIKTTAGTVHVCGYKFTESPQIVDFTQLKPHVAEVFGKDTRLIIEEIPINQFVDKFESDEFENNDLMKESEEDGS